MVDKKTTKKQQKKVKKPRAPRQPRKKKSELPSSVQALLNYLGSGGPAPTPQQPVITQQKERAGVDSIETLSGIIRQQTLMNASYMQNMERLAFKNELSDQLKKQGEAQAQQIKEVKEEQKKVTSEVIQEVEKVQKEKSLQEQRASLMRSINRYKKLNKPEKLKFYQEQLEILESTIKEQSLASLKSRMPTYEGPLAGQSNEPITVEAASSMDLSNLALVKEKAGPTVFTNPAKTYIKALSPDETLDISRNILSVAYMKKEKEFKDLLKGFEQIVQKRKGKEEEIAEGLESFKYKDSNASSGV